MTKSFLKSFFLGLGGLAMSVSLAFAQDTYEWDAYGVGFSVASDVIIQQSSSDSFTAVTSDGEIAINISPWLDETVDTDGLAEATISMAIELYAFDDSEVDGDYIEIDSFDGYYLIASQDGFDEPDYLLVAVLLDTESETNLIVVIGFDDGNDEEALDILTSLYSY